MSQELVSVREDAGVAETTELMRMKGVRRLPVTDAGGSLVGIVASEPSLSWTRIFSPPAGNPSSRLRAFSQENEAYASS